MAYFRNDLISRPGYSGVGGWTDTIGDVAKGALSFFGSQQKAAGAAEALATQNRDLIAAQNAQASGAASGLSPTVMIVGGVAILGAAYFLLRKKKSA